MAEPDRRVESIDELPDESLRCAAAGRHVGFWHNDPTMKKVGGWGGIDSREVNWHCDCGRWKTEIIDYDTGETLSRSPQYGGGVLLLFAEQGVAGGVNQREAKAAWLHRMASRRIAAA